MSRFLTALLLAGLAVPSAAVQAADLPYVNFENHPVHALDLSPDRRLLAVAHTADQRVQLLDVSGPAPVPLGHVVVGVDPVSVRWRDDGELWVVNHVSDSISIVDVPGRRVRATLATADEPYDVVFAGGRAFISCSQANRLQVHELADLARAPLLVPILAEDPRALAVSPDGRTVYVAIFESGNATTILAGGLSNNSVIAQSALPNVVSDPRGPYGGVNPPPNVGSIFVPALNSLATPPRVGLIVRRGADQKWRDDNNADWTEFVSGSLSTASGRRPGWNLADRDLAVIDAGTLAVRYVTGLMNIGMALAVNPASGEPTLVGTEAFNEQRYEPNVNGRFVRVHLARVAPAAGGGQAIVDLNPQLDYARHTVAQAVREQAIGDPRAIAWSSDGQRGWVAGLGSNNVLPITASGARRGAPIAVGQGPAGLALDDARQRLYVWNHFDASLSVVDTAAGSELQRLALFNPLPQAIRAGRPLLYDTHRTSGLGQVSCASCHVDARMDRLAWDLGDPSAAPARFDQNCITTVAVDDCEDFHAMKGPMTTQTLQDIIGHEPFHWRGDRAGIEAFNPAFEGLLGDDRQLSATEMQDFENFLATITFPPNPFRSFDNTLPPSIDLAGHYTSGRFAMAGQPLPPGNPQRGLQLYTRELLDAPLACASCHTLPTGMAANGPLLLPILGFPVGGRVLPHGPLGENHLGIVSIDGSTNVSIKVPQLRNQYEKVGFEMSQGDNLAGFGFLHDGSVDSLAKFLSARAFSVRSDQDVADLVALMLAFSGSDFGSGANPALGGPAPPSRDSHAAAGTQLTLASPAISPRALQLQALAAARKLDLVVHAGRTGHVFDAASERFLPDDGSTPLTSAELRERAGASAPQTWTLVPAGLGRRLGIDRDGDGVADGIERRQGSNPADAASTTLRATAGLWFNPARSGHGFDLQYSGESMFVLWYTYEDDGSPTWYLASGPRANPWRAELLRFRWNPATRTPLPQAVGTLALDFSDAGHGRFDWTLGSRSGSEAVVPLIALDPLAQPNPDPTGAWYDSTEPGWGLTLYAGAGTRVAILYFYDASQQPRWVLGQGPASASGTLPLQGYRGFCPDCAHVAPTTAPGGSLELRLDGSRSATLRTDAFHAGQPEARWQRGPLAIVPLSDAPLRPELQ